MADVQASGLAGKIRACLSSEQFDLAGYDEERVGGLISTAFGAPLDAPQEMIRITFLVGGGKLVRARYPEELPKWTAAALRNIGFEEDRGAAETFDSQGTFKQQHDTGQNLKYVIVYPKVACAATAGAAGGGAGGGEGPAINTKSPEYVMCSSDFEAFKKKYKSKISSWRQAKTLLTVLTSRKADVAAIEEKLCSGTLLSAEEQAVYDGSTGLEEKMSWLQGEIKTYIDDGKLTAKEKSDVLSHLQGSLVTLEEKLQEAKTEGKAKKVEKLEEMKKEGLERKAAIEKAPAVQLRLKHGDEVQRLRLMLLPVLDLEAKARGISLTMDELKKVGTKSDIEADIADLEAASRGWFEAEEDFQARVAFEEAAADAAYNKKKGNKKGGGGGGGGSWSTVASSGAGRKPGTGSAKTKAPTGFAALAMLDD